MYYYIMEPPRGDLARLEKIKDILGDLGIAGETVSPSSARTIEELTHLGVIKGYSTIVAVGRDSLINRVLTVLATSKTAKDVVLGIIPDNFQKEISQKIGIRDLYSACKTLKERRLETIDLVCLEPNKYFLTEATVETFRNQEIYFSFENIQGVALANKIIIKPGLEIFFHDKTLKGSPFSRFFRWLFSRTIPDIYSTYLRAKRFRLEAKNNLPIKVSEEVIAKTPATFYNRSRILKIIVGRSKVKTKIARASGGQT